MSRRVPRAGLIAALTAAALWGATQAAVVGSASTLEVDAGFAQTWVLPGPDGEPEEPEEPEGPGEPQADLSACGDLAQYDEVVYGSDEADELVGGNRPQVLVGLGGDDVIVGGNQHDCLVGGAGADELFGENGKDVLVGGAGRDHLDGGNGTDLLFGGEGDALCAAPDGDVLVDECEEPEEEPTDELADEKTTKPQGVAKGVKETPAGPDGAGVTGSTPGPGASTGDPTPSGDPAPGGSSPGDGGSPSPGHQAPSASEGSVEEEPDESAGTPD